MKNWIKALPLVAMLVMGVTAQAAEKPKVIRFAFPGSTIVLGKPSALINNLIVDQQLLEKEFSKDGIKIEVSNFVTAGPGVNEALAAGLADFANYGDFPIVTGKAGGLKTKFILSTDLGANTYIIGRTDLHIKSVKELKGRSFGIFKGTNLQPPFIKLLQANGLTEKDVRTVNLNTTDAQAALIAKSIDAIGIGADRPVVDLGVGEVIGDTNQLPLSTRATTGLVVQEDFAKRYPDIVKRVVKVYLQANRFASDEKNREALLKILVNTGAKYKYLKSEYALLPLKVRHNPLLTQGNTVHYKDLVDFSERNKLIRKKYDVDQWIDKSYEQAALKELGLENYWAK